MKSRTITVSLFTAMLLASCAAGRYEKSERGITVNIAAETENSVRKVRLQVIDDKIIRVSATPDKKFSSDTSLVVIPPRANVEYTIAETDSTVSLSTSQLTATVSFSTGDVKFYNKDGRLIVAEADGGREFSPIEVEGTKGYTVRQVFESLDKEEGIYGLGQHQSDEFNYKGKNEELFQYNTKVSVPFIVSTDNYGILWDSYSLCRFGNPEPYKQLGQVFKLYDKDGKEGALTGTYVPAKAEEPTIVQREDSIYFEHLIRKELKHVVNLPQDFNYQGSHVTYEGEIEPSESGEFKFILYYSGYMSVFIDGKEVVPERWRTAWNPNSYKFSVNLEAGKRVPVKIQWEPNGAVAYCGLRVYSPVDDKEQMQMSWWGEMQSQIDYYFIVVYCQIEAAAGLDEFIVHPDHHPLPGEGQHLQPHEAPLQFGQRRESLIDLHGPQELLPVHAHVFVRQPPCGLHHRVVQHIRLLQHVLGVHAQGLCGDHDFLRVLRRLRRPFRSVSRCHSLRLLRHRSRLLARGLSILRALLHRGPGNLRILPGLLSLVKEPGGLHAHIKTNPQHQQGIYNE